MSANQFQVYPKETNFYDLYGAVYAIYGAVHTPIDDNKFKKDYISYMVVREAEVQHTMVAQADEILRHTEAQNGVIEQLPVDCRS